MTAMDALDTAIINSLQGGFPLSHAPYAEVAQQLGIEEATLLARLQALLDSQGADPLWPHVPGGTHGRRLCAGRHAGARRPV